MRPSAVGHFVILALVASCAEVFIVPEELVSFLSIVYSNIPPIRKGTDSRVGVGFRLGPHADAQIVLELGPQTNTRPLGAAAPSFSAPSSSKRHTAPALALDDAPLDDVAPAALNPAAGSWLTSWRTSVAARNRPAANLVDNDLVSQEEVSGPGAVTLPDPTKLSGAPLVSHLRQLYRKEAVRPTERQPKRQPERQAERQPELQPETLPSWDSKRTVERPVASKGSKRPKSAGKTVGKVPASAKQFTTQDLSDVSLD